MQPALGAVGPRPAALAARAGHGARRAADRAIAGVVQRVIGQVALDDPPPDVVLGPVDERVVLDEVAALVALDRARVAARERARVAAKPAHPRLRAGERPVERLDLGVAAAVAGRPGAVGVVDLDGDPEVLLEAPPRLDRLGEQRPGVDRRDPRGVGQAHEHVDEHRGRLLERAQQDQLRSMALDRLLEELLGRHASTGSGSSRSLHHSTGVRSANSRKVSPSSWLVSYSVKIRSSVSWGAPCGPLLIPTSPKRGSGPRRPPMRMSMASTNSPSTFLSTPSMPTSAIWCCAQLDEQPAKCSRKSSPWPFGRTCSSRNWAISTARLLV